MTSFVFCRGLLFRFLIFLIGSSVASATPSSASFDRVMASFTIFQISISKIFNRKFQIRITTNLNVPNRTHNRTTTTTAPVRQSDWEPRDLGWGSVYQSGSIMYSSVETWLDILKFVN